MVRRPLLVTRPQPSADAMVARARARGIPALACPLFEPCAIDWQLPATAPSATSTALMITSANAVRYSGEQRAALRHLPTYCIGNASEQVAAADGFAVQYVSIDKTAPESPTARAQHLLDHIATMGYRHIIWLCGREHTAIVAPPDIDLSVCACYAMEAIEPPALWWERLAQAAMVAVMSARAAERVSTLCSAGQRGAEYRGRVTILALSRNIAEAAGQGWREVHIATRMDSESMLDRAEQIDRK